MHRDVVTLANQPFDVVVVGAGLHGACTAYDASVRGLQVALIERGDFVSGTSANSFKIIHGGIRYLQHADVYRIRESGRERTALFRVAPHLAHPLPIMIPTYGHGVKGPEVLAAGLGLYDLLVFDRNRGIEDPDRQVPGGRVISREDVLGAFPTLDTRGLTGAAVFADGQIYNPPRLGLAFIRSAAAMGCVAVNYLEAVGFHRSGDRVTGVLVRDRLSGETFTVQAKIVVNAAGPWAETLLRRDAGLALIPPGTYSRDACFVVRRRLTGRTALAVPGQTRDPDAIVSRAARHLFLAPWREHTLVGTWHVVHHGDPDAFAVTAAELQAFLDEVNAGCPGLDLCLNDVTLWNAGLTLFGENADGAVNLRYGKRSRVVDHKQSHGVDGLITQIGVRLTTARGVAERVVDLVYRKLDRPSPRCTTAERSVHGGATGPFEAFVASLAKGELKDQPEIVVRSLAHNYGSEVGPVLAHSRAHPRGWERLGGSHVLGGEVLHAVREEMAVRLADVVFRRTDLGTADIPRPEALRAAAELMGGELDWGEKRIANELAEVTAAYERLAPHRTSQLPEVPAEAAIESPAGS
jgi:glycerol-3-phosphate dehydrogenase